MGTSMKMQSNMAPNTGEDNLTVILQFLKDSWPMIVAMFSIYQIVDRVAKYYAKKQDARLRELIQAEVTPQITNLTEAINALREEIGKLKK